MNIARQEFELQTLVCEAARRPAGSSNIFDAAGLGTANPMFLGRNEIPYETGALEWLEAQKRTLNLQGIPLDEHELGHFLLAVLTETHPKLMEGKTWIGDLLSETFANAMEEIFRGSYRSPINELYDDRTVFAERIVSSYHSQLLSESCRRAVIWMTAEETGMTIAEVMRSCGYYAPQLTGDNKNVRLVDLQDSSFVAHSKTHGYISGHITETRTGGESQVACSYYFPEKLAENPPFDPASPMPIIEAEAFYEALLPAIHHVQNLIYEARLECVNDDNPEGRFTGNRAARIYSRINIGNIIRVVKNKKSLNPELQDGAPNPADAIA